MLWRISTLQYMPKFFDTAARTDLVICVHGAGLVHSQKRSLANQRCVHLLLRVRSSVGFEREVLKICHRDCLLGHRCIRETLTCWWDQRSHIKVKGYLRSNCKMHEGWKCKSSSNWKIGSPVGNCIRKWILLNSFGEMNFLEESYKYVQKIQILKILRAPSVWNQWVCL